jgi:hypothetical protein
MKENVLSTSVIPSVAEGSVPQGCGFLALLGMTGRRTNFFCHPERVAERRVARDDRYGTIPEIFNFQFSIFNCIKFPHLANNTSEDKKEVTI